MKLPIRQGNKTHTHTLTHTEHGGLCGSLVVGDHRQRDCSPSEEIIKRRTHRNG